MKTEISQTAALPAHLDGLVNQFCGLVDALLEAGVHPYHVAEASLLAGLPLFMEVTRAGTMEDALLCLASKFDGNQLRRAN